jgi:hypothetical protein
MPEIQLSDEALGELTSYLRSLRPPRRGELAAVPVTIETKDARRLSGVAANQSFEDMQSVRPAAAFICCAVTVRVSARSPHKWTGQDECG